MSKKEKHNIDLIILAVAASIILIVFIIAAIFPRSKRVDYCDIIARNRMNARTIQNVLNMYYYDHAMYPKEKCLSKVLKLYFNEIPCYHDGRKMIRSYQRVSINAKKQAYKICFYDDKETNIDESKIVLTEGSDEYKLFK